MKTSIWVLLIFGCFLAGCSKSDTGNSGDKFTSDRDELEYLSSISQPTVSQFHRKKELEEKMRMEWQETETRLYGNQEKQRRLEIEAEAKAKKAADAVHAAEALKEAREFEAFFIPGAPEKLPKYRRLITEFPDSPEAQLAKARIKELETERSP